MDLTKAVAYRGANLNNATPTVGKLGLIGCIVERADVRAIDYVGASEKRRLADGVDTIEPYMALHRFVLQGTVFGQTRGDTYDRLQVLKEAFNPVKALLQSPSTKGFLPFTFTNTAARSVNCRPMGLKYEYDATKAGTNAKVGGQDAVALGIRWSAELLVNTTELLDCGEWPPNPPPLGTSFLIAIATQDAVNPSTDLTTAAHPEANPWTLAWHSGNISAASVIGCGAGPPFGQSISMWYRRTNPGETAAVAKFKSATAGSVVSALWVYEIDGVDPNDITVVGPGTQHVNNGQSFGVSATASQPSVLFGGMAWAKVNYDAGWLAGGTYVADYITPGAGIPLIGSGGKSALNNASGAPCPWNWHAYAVGSGGLALSASADSHGSGSGAYTCGWNAGWGGLLIAAPGTFAILQSGFGGTGLAGDLYDVILPAPPTATL